MEIRKEIEYYGNDGSYPTAYVHLYEDNSIHGYVRGDEEAAKVWEYIKRRSRRSDHQES